MSQSHPSGTDPNWSLRQFAADARARRIPAWLMSALLHLVALLLLAFLVSGAPRGGAGETVRAGGIVLVQRTGGRIEYFSEDSSEAGMAAGAGGSQTAPRTNAPRSAADALPGAEDVPADPAKELPGGETVDRSAGGNWADALPGAGDFTATAGPSKKLGGTTHTYVFGAEGHGSVFLYVFDRSSSMSGFEGRPLAAAKAELIKSLRQLRPTDQFQIIFYNNRVTIFNPLEPQPPRLMFADETNKALAERFVREITASGGTRHMEPLRMALRMAPDVVFFLTDAADPQLSPRQLAELHRLNKGTVINAIEFGSGPALGEENFLVRLARQNDGQHVYVDVSKLPLPAGE